MGVLVSVLAGFPGNGTAWGGGVSSTGPDPTGIPDPSAAASWELETLDGNRVRPLEPGTDLWNVLIFLSNDCPIANRYAPEIRRIAEKYEGRRVRFWMVHPLADESPEAIREHAKSHALPGTVARDRTLALTRGLGITVTPEVAVVDRAGHLVYRGRIDDRFPALGQKRSKPNRRDLREALDALIAGEPVPQPRTRAVGCVLPKSG